MLCNTYSDRSNAICYSVFSTFSLPTMLVDGESMDLDSAETAERLLVEARGDADPVILSTIASQLNVPTEQVKATVNDMAGKGEEISAASVVQKYTR